MNYFSYFSEIEAAFVRRRKRNLLLSPLDWALIEAWKERGVPLFVVLRAIDAVFDSAAAYDAIQPRKRPIKSLLYCRDEVEAQYAVWLEAQVGANAKTDAPAKPQAAAEIANSQNFDSHHGEPNLQNETEQQVSTTQILRHINFLQTHFAGENKKLNGSWQNLSRRVLIRLKEAENGFAVDQNAERLETILSELDNKIDGILNKLLPSEKVAEVEKQTTVQLHGFKRQMPPEVWRETFQTLLVKNLREAADLPRFSLFYL